MARPPKVSWHSINASWTSRVGPISPKTGRRTPVYKIFRGIPKTRRADAQRILEDYVRDRDQPIDRPADYTFKQLCRAYLTTTRKAAAARHFHETGQKPPADLVAWLDSPDGRRWTRDECLTFIGHRAVLGRACDFDGGKFGARKAQAITAVHLKELVDSWAAAGRKPNYIGRMVASIQAVLNWGATPVAGRTPEQVFPNNPLKGFSHQATQAPRAEDRYAGDDELEAFLAWAYARAADYTRVKDKAKAKADNRGGDLERRWEKMTVDLIAVAGHTGARPGELRKAAWSHYEPRAAEVAGEWWGRITLPPRKWKSGRKTGKAREVYLPPDAVRIVESIRSIPDRHPEFIWTHRRGPRADDRGAGVVAHGEPWNLSSLCRKIAALRREAMAAGIDVKDEGENRFVLYRLRHTAAAKLLMAGVPIATAAKLLGTSVAMIERVYESFLGKALAEAASLGLVRRPAISPSRGDEIGTRTGPSRPSPDPPGKA